MWLDVHYNMFHIPLQTMVKKMIKEFELFMCYNHLPDNVSTVGFYFLRIFTDPIPMPSSLEHANSILPACFETGTINHKPLNALERMMTHIYMPMLMIQGEEVNNISKNTVSIWLTG